MSYLELFEQVADHVRSQGVKVVFKRGKPLAASAIERACTKSVIPIPASLAEFYAEVGEGLRFVWQSKDDGNAFANYEVPNLELCMVESFDSLRWRTEWNDNHAFPFTADPVLAKQTALKMRKWMRFYDVGNGDMFWLDTAFDPAPVVYDQHDWFDGGTGENGGRLADSLLQFYTAWAQVCFQLPRTSRWPTVLKKDGPYIDWSNSEFREPFRLSSVR